MKKTLCVLTTLIALTLPGLGFATPISATTALMPTSANAFNRIDLPDKNTHQVDVTNAGEYAVPIFLRGSFNDWGNNGQMSFDGIGAYEVTMSLSVGAWEFRFTSEDGATIDLGSDGGNPDVAIDAVHMTSNGLFGNLFLDIGAAGLYSFLLDTSQSMDSPMLLVSSVLAVAEPGTIALFGLAFLGLVLARRMRNSR